MIGTGNLKAKVFMPIYAKLHMCSYLQQFSSLFYSTYIRFVLTLLTLSIVFKSTDWV